MVKKIELKKPVIVVNFKNYEESTNKKSLSLAKICDSFKKNIIICVTAIDLHEVAKSVKIPVFAQHVDGFDYGSHTGKILPEVVKLAGGKGSIINHSEDRYALKDIGIAIEDCKKEGIFSLVCAQTSLEAKKIAKFSPDAIAIEPPELIGGDISVTTANPFIITKTIKAVEAVNPSIPILCGAGIKDGNDVKKAIELGAKGVLLASGITKAKNPKKVLSEMMSAIN